MRFLKQAITHLNRAGRLPSSRSHLKGEIRYGQAIYRKKKAIQFATVPAPVIFSQLLANTKEGYFADPLYGGNRDKVGWKLLGFPGVPSGQYRELVTSHEPYHVEPVSVLDIQTGKVPLDAEGFPKHVVIKRNSNKES